MRFYGFDADEIVDEADGMLPLDIDPKLAWALRHRERFPLDVEPRSRERCCCACRASAPRRSTASSPRAA